MSKEALKLALEALSPDPYRSEWAVEEDKCKAITAIKAALEAKDEPVAYINVEQRKLEWAKYMSWDTPTVVNLPKISLYTTPPQRTWVGLTDEEIWEWFRDNTALTNESGIRIVRAIESKLKDKNVL
jgi:hypothetical protein